MSGNSDKFIHKATTNQPGKWLSIALSNLVAEMTRPELEELQVQTQAALKAHREARIAKLVALDAPAVILDREYELLTEVLSGKHPAQAIIRRRLAKLA